MCRQYVPKQADISMLTVVLGGKPPVAARQRFAESIRAATGAESDAVTATRPVALILISGNSDGRELRAYVSRWPSPVPAVLW
jgi:hypothetical protein